MTTVHIMLRDATDGLVDVETTITAVDPDSNAQALAGRINTFLAEIAQEKQAPTEITPKLELVKS